MRVYAKCMTGLEGVWISRMDDTLHLEGAPGRRRPAAGWPRERGRAGMTARWLPVRVLPGARIGRGIWQKVGFRRQPMSAPVAGLVCV